MSKAATTDSTPLLGKRERASGDESAASGEHTFSKRPNRHVPRRSKNVCATAPPLEEANTKTDGKRAYRRSSEQVRKCDGVVAERWDAWNVAQKRATVMYNEQLKLDEAFYKSSGGLHRSKKDGRLSAPMISRIIQKETGQYAEME